MFRWCVKQIRYQCWPLIFLTVTLILCGLTAWLLIWPAYQNPSARMYTSKLGYATVLRQSGKPFPVKTAIAVQRQVTGVFLGEGLVQSEPIQVPMIAMAGIVKVHVQEGDHVKKGQLLVELDDTRIKLKIEAAAAALETARAEQERVKVGSVNILLDERPEMDEIQLKAAKATAEAEQEILKRYRALYKKRSISNEKLLAQKGKSKNADVFLEKLLLRSRLAYSGKQNSLRIAQSTIREAEMGWRHRLAQLDDYKTYAPADGIVERTLVHAGEFNQDPGRPAMILASGLWFEANVDQTALGQLAPGNRVEVRLSAYQDQVIHGTVERIKPLVNFSLGGPETNRPIRPMGTGAPEWPATFAVRVKLDPTQTTIVPGLTGFARIINTRTSTCVPRGSVSATSGGRGIVYVVNEEENGCIPRDVSVGWTDEGWVEVRSGLAEGEKVIVDGYQVLEPGDQIACKAIKQPEAIKQPNESQFANAAETSDESHDELTATTH